MGLLRRLVGEAMAQSILGDLEEERARRARSSPVAARLWSLRTRAAVIAVAAAALVVPGLRRLSQRRGGQRYTRQTLRTLRRAPWYSLSFVGVIAIGLGLASTVFAVVDGALFKSLPYPEADRLFVVEPGRRGTEPPAAGNSTSLRELTAWSEALPDVELTGYTRGLVALADGDVFETQLNTAIVRQNFFDVVGTRPAMGGFRPQDFAAAESGSVTPAVVTDEFWRVRLAGAPDVIGRRLTIGPRTDTALEIAGVMPPGFVFPEADRLSIIVPFVPRPRQLDDWRDRTFRRVLARVPAGTVPAVVAERLEGAMAILAETNADQGRDEAFDDAALIPLGDHVTRRARPMFGAAFAAAILLMVLACVNVSALMTARSLDRARDFALRRAIGAGTLDLVRLALTEAATLAAIGTVAGLGLAWLLLHAVLQLLPDAYLLFKIPGVDWRVLAFGAATGSMAAAIVAAWPVAQVLATSAPAHLAGTPHETMVGRGAARISVVAVQVAGGLALAVAGTLFVGSLATLARVDVGIDLEHVAALDMRFPMGPGALDRDGQDQVAADVLERVRRLPGVTAAAFTSSPLYTRSARAGGIRLPRPSDGQGFFTGHHSITSGYAEVLRPEVTAGRWFTNEELRTGGDVVVVDDVVARLAWPGESAVGQQVESLFPRRTLTVVGVLRAIRLYSWDQPDDGWAALFLPARPSTGTLLLRADAPARALAEVTAILTSLPTPVRISRSGPLTDLIAESVRTRYLQLLLFGGFAGAALLVLATGVLGQVAMSTARRTREVGIRMALGATRHGVVRQLIQEQMPGVLLGLAAGATLAAWGVRTLESYLYQIGVYDSRVWMAAIAVVALTAGVGALLPSLRASRIDPVAALRTE